MTRNGRKYQYRHANLRLFKPKFFNISEILHKQIPVLCDFCMLLG